MHPFTSQAMNPIVQHFLPSVVRGVYRYDYELQDVADLESFARFIKGKMRFLPTKVRDAVSRLCEGPENMSAAKGRFEPPENLPKNRFEHARRWKSFFAAQPYFKAAVQDESDAEKSDKFLELEFVKRVLVPLLSDEGLRMVQPQRQVGPYFVDFALEGASKLALEVDGFGKFKEVENLDNFLKRQNYITKQGWRVIRYSYGQVMKTTGRTLRELKGILRADSKLSHVLNLAAESASFVGFEAPEAGRSSVEIVNDFYRIQDWFANRVLSEAPTGDGWVFRDEFSLDFPFVASALSTLYEFLDAVASVVEVDFDLPRVEVCGTEPPRDWGLHDRVSVRTDDDVSACSVDASTVQAGAGWVPAPARSAGPVIFRKGLGPEQIHDRLLHLTQSLFEYPEGTKQFQDRILKRMLDGDNVLGISATGSGKSFCYWLPALLRPGLTLVISPLRSLMRDQRLTLRNYGIASAEFINVDVKPPDQRRILEEVKAGYVRMLYVAPERLRIKKFLGELDRLQEFVPINFLAVDEAHCISEWGHEFRPAYLKLPLLRETLDRRNPGLRLIALTATAGKPVEQDMRSILELEEHDVVRDRTVDRVRFSYQVVRVPDGISKTQAYHEILTRDIPKSLRQPSLPRILEGRNQRGEKALGLAFCIYADPHGEHSIDDGVAHYLFQTMGLLEPEARFERSRSARRTFRLDAFSTGKVRAFSSKPPSLCPKCNCYAYTSARRDRQGTHDDEDDPEDDQGEPGNATGMKACPSCGEFEGCQAISPPNWPRMLEQNQENFKDGLYDILVATKGFGMGIDKSSVRFVVHTCMPSGLESWYQEAGRAGRDNERAHVALLVDPPSGSCISALRKEFGKPTALWRPECKNYKCPHGKEGLCDYGMQHMFLSKSYPGVVSDSIWALRRLDSLMMRSQQEGENPVTLNSSDAILGRDELALYRLMSLGLVEDYALTYEPNPRFEVSGLAPGLFARPDATNPLETVLRERLQKHLRDIPGVSAQFTDTSKAIQRLKMEHGTLDASWESIQRRQRHGSRMRPLHDLRPIHVYRSVYDHLLVLLACTYDYVLKMRYGMLHNLWEVVDEKNCRRRFLLQFDDFLGNDYKCGCCDLCCPTLEFPVNGRIAPPVNPSVEERKTELRELYDKGDFALDRLDDLTGALSEYPEANYRYACGVLEADPNNLPALFVANVFSPDEEAEGNAKRLLRTANERPLPLPQVRELYRTSRDNVKTGLLLCLNDTDTACDSPDGWKFLAAETGKPEHQEDKEIGLTHECLEFFLLVQEDLPGDIPRLASKVRELEAAFHA